MLPNCIIIGAYKCGTSALYTYLGAHPEVELSIGKEPSFFCRTRNWHKGVDWYKAQWPRRNSVMVEASPQYSYADDWLEVPERIKQIIPDVKLLFMVRDPIDRMVSHYLHSFKKYDETKSFEQAVRTPSLSSSFYTQCSRYYTILECYRHHFEDSQIKVVVSEDLKANTEGCMQEIFAFLDIDASFTSALFQRPVNRTSDQLRKLRIAKSVERLRRETLLKHLSFPDVISQAYRAFTRRPLPRPRVSPELRKELVELLQGEIDQFRKVTDLSLDQWSM